MMRVTFRTANGHYLRAYQSGVVAADAPVVGELDEWWTLIPFGGDSYALQSVHGRYLCAELDGSVNATRDDVGPWETWHLEPAGQGGVAFRSDHGRYLCAEGGGGGVVIANREAIGEWEVFTPSEPIGSRPPVGGRVVRLLDGPVRVIGRSFGDATGPRILHGCTDFGALRRFKEQPDETLRGLDVVARFKQYVRFAWRLNGSPWDMEWPGPGGWPMTLDPLRDSWVEDTMRRYLQALHDRGLRANVTSADMYHWSDAQAEEWFRRIAQVAASVSPDVVWLSAVTNEMRGTMPGGESDENIRKCQRLLKVWHDHYPWSQMAISDPGSQDKAGMVNLSPAPATVALIHNVRWSVPDALRRCFNTPYENYPNKPVVEDEPTGQNGKIPPPFGQRVFQPVNDDDDILAIYTMHVIAGMASTFFDDSSLVDRQPLDANFGLKETSMLWREMDLPEDIGQGQLYHGGRSESAMNVIDSGADRADGCVAPDGRFFGVISGEQGGWRVRSRWDAQLTAWTATGVVVDQRVRAGEVLPIAGATPTIVRFEP